MKKTNKIITVALIILTILTIGVSSFATISPGSFTPTNPTDTKQLTDLGGSIIGVVRTVGVLIAVVVLLILGIKYMMGSAEEKADYKKSMIPYIVGAVLVFAASAISGIIFDLAKGIGASAT